MSESERGTRHFDGWGRLEVTGTCVALTHVLTHAVGLTTLSAMPEQARKLVTVIAGILLAAGCGGGSSGGGPPAAPTPFAEIVRPAYSQAESARSADVWETFAVTVKTPPAGDDAVQRGLLVAAARHASDSYQAREDA